MRRRSLLPFLLFAALLAGPVSAAKIVIVNSDPAGTGLNDPTPVAPVGGNAGTTLGQQRLNVFQQAAAIWGSLLTSTVTVRVSASFAPLACTATTATLGGTHPNWVYSDFAGAPVAGTWYVKALANKFAGSDLDGTSVDMTAQFNSNLGQTDCFTGFPFYLGLDNLHGSNPSFLTVALHEFAHGLGFYSGVDSTGAFLGATSSPPTPLPTIFDRFIYDDTLGQTWDKLTNAQRATSQVNTGNLTWSGTAANAFASTYLGKRSTDATLLAGADATGRMLLYAPNPFEMTSSVSHFDTSAFPNLLMEPNISDDLPIGVDATLPLFTDIGWFAGTSGPTTTYLLPSSAHAPGKNSAFYTTDLTIANRGSTDSNLTLQFLGHDQDGTAGPKQLRALATNKAVTYADVLASVFGVSAADAQNYGAILITADSASLKIVSQTSTPPPNGVGTFGQSVPAQSANAFVTPASPKSLIGLRDDTAFRTNAVLANATTSSVTVTLTLLAADGSTFGTTTRTLPPLGMTQVDNVVTTLQAPFGTTNAVLVVSTATPGAQVATYAAVIDNNTQDPRTILP